MIGNRGPQLPPIRFCPLSSILIVGVFLQFFAAIDSSQSVASILISPDSQTATLNSTVLLQCRIEVVPGMTVSWVKNNFGMGNTRADIRAYHASRKNSTISRYDLIRDLRAGEYDLQISNVDLSDDASFHCQTLVNGKSVLSKKAKVTVLVPAQPPVLSQIMRSTHIRVPVSLTSPAVVDEHAPLHLECLARGGKPGAQLTWYIGGVRVRPIKGEFHGLLNGRVNNIRRRSSHPKLIDSYSQLSTSVLRLHINKVIECRSENKGYKIFTQRPAQTKTDVHYAPEVSLTPDPQKANNEYIENEMVTMRCLATGRPDTFYWEWFVNGQKVDNIAESWYRIQVTRSLHRSTIRCEAMSNKKGQADIRILVRYGPQFREPSVLMYPASVSDDVTMECEADSNPIATIDWTREGSRDILHKGITITRRGLEESDFGTYICTATAPGFPPVSKKMYLAKKMAPLVEKGMAIYAKKGRPIRLRCSISSVPLPAPAQVVWTKGDSVVLEDKNHNFDFEHFLGGVVSILYISKVTDRDLGSYNCSVTNGYGADTARIILEVDEDFPVKFITAAVISLLLTIFVVTLVCCACRKSFCAHNYQKAQAHENGTTLTVGLSQPGTVMEMDAAYATQNYYNWGPQHSQDSEPTYLRYGRDIDPRGLHLSGSLPRYRPSDLSSNGNEKLMLQIEEEEMLGGSESVSSMDSSRRPPSTLVTIRHPNGTSFVPSSLPRNTRHRNSSQQPLRAHAWQLSEHSRSSRESSQTPIFDQNNTSHALA